MFVTHRLARDGGTTEEAATAARTRGDAIRARFHAQFERMRDSGFTAITPEQVNAFVDDLRGRCQQGIAEQPIATKEKQ
jgi:hypothetical protein